MSDSQPGVRAFKGSMGRNLGGPRWAVTNYVFQKCDRNLKEKKLHYIFRFYTFSLSSYDTHWPELLANYAQYVSMCRLYTVKPRYNEPIGRGI